LGKNKHEAKKTNEQGGGNQKKHEIKKCEQENRVFFDVEPNDLSNKMRYEKKTQKTQNSLEITRNK